MAEPQKSFADQINDQISNEGFSKSFAGDYMGSPKQLKTYEDLKRNDQIYQQYITQTYGSYENYLTMNRIGQAQSVYDPANDYVMDVTVVTENASYKSDHISTQEVIMEALSGVCTVIFMKMDGSVGRITGTLDSRAVPPKQMEYRKMFFSPQANDRVVMWDLNKQDWRSFYMDRVIRFVRDDTIDLE